MWPIDEHGLIWRADALDCGVTELELRQARRERRIYDVGRGAFALASAYPAEPSAAARQHYRFRCLAAGAAAARRESDGRVVSHQSAAAILGLDLLLPDRRLVHLTNGRSGGGNSTRERMIHSGLVADDDVIEIGRLRLTNLPRTAVDVALSQTDFAKILTVFDGALRAGVSRADLERRLAMPRRGVARARFALSLASGLSANPGESWSRAQMIEAGVPAPKLQSEYVLPDGHLAICDYDWDGLVIGEFDGFGKYRREVIDTDEDAGDIVIREKIREDALRGLGLGVVRWRWEHLQKRTLVRLLQQHLPTYGVREWESAQASGFRSVSD
ncbi:MULTISPECIES: hypothetical protein [Gordonia]|nr:hypothetical protein [Gordonia sp. QH-12]